MKSSDRMGLSSARPPATRTLRRLFLLLALGMTRIPAWAVSVDLGSDTAMPGSSVLIPLSLTATPEEQIATLIAEITFPDKWVAFRKVRSSFATELLGGEIQTALKPDPHHPGESVLTVTIRAKKALVNGIVCTLELQVKESEETPDQIPLPRKVAAVTLSGQRIEPASGKAGFITVSRTPPAFVNCFFFTH